MLSAQSLERASPGYRNGYHHGYNRTTPIPPLASTDPFAVGDYDDGYAAGENDRNWDEKIRGGYRG